MADMRVTIAGVEFANPSLQSLAPLALAANTWSFIRCPLWEESPARGLR